MKEFKTFVRRPVTGARMEMMRMKIQQQHHARTHHHNDIVEETNGNVGSAPKFNNVVQRRVTVAEAANYIKSLLQQNLIQIN